MAEKPANPNEQTKGKTRKLTPAMQRYRDTGREAANKHRNMATAERRACRDDEKRPVRLAKRKAGALRRLDNRIRATAGKKSQRPLRAALQHIRIKVADAAAIYNGTQ